MEGNEEYAEYVEATKQLASAERMMQQAAEAAVKELRENTLKPAQERYSRALANMNKTILTEAQ